MAKGKKTGGRNFLPGNSASPGRPPLPKELNEARKLNKIEVAKVINKLLFMSLNDIKMMIDDPKTPSLHLMLANIMKHAAEKGDQFRTNFIFDRCIGKVTENVKVDLPKPTIIKLIDQDAFEVIGSFKDSDDEEGDEDGQ